MISVDSCLAGYALRAHDVASATPGAPVTLCRRMPEPTGEQKAAEELVRRAREQGLPLNGPDGLLKQPLPD